MEASGKPGAFFVFVVPMRCLKTTRQCFHEKAGYNFLLIYR